MVNKKIKKNGIVNIGYRAHFWKKKLLLKHIFLILKKIYMIKRIKIMLKKFIRKEKI